MGTSNNKWATLEVEHAVRNEGFSCVAGIDEVGRGSLAGPVTIGLVVLPEEWHIPVADSKVLSPKQRAETAKLIREAAVVCEIMHVEAGFIDSEGIVGALREAGNRIWDLLDPIPDLVLLDGSHNYLNCPVPVRMIVQGDRISASIAAASIVAKEARDELMRNHAIMYPEYGFESHVGYGTVVHRQAIERHGPTVLHRRTFLRNILK